MWSNDQILVILAFLWEKLSKLKFYTNLTWKTDFFEGWNNLRLVLDMTLNIYSCVGRGLKLKVRKYCRKLGGSLFALFPSSHPKSDRKWIDRFPFWNRFHCFTDFSVNVTCNVTVIILEDMFGNIKSVVFIYGGIG